MSQHTPLYRFPRRGLLRAPLI